MDFNKAKIVSYTKMTNENNYELSILEQVAYCARISNPLNQNNYDTSEKLCKYLLDNHHYSPFEMVNIVIEIETTRDISRQLLRHRTFTFQEFSQRYAVVDNFTIKECRFQDIKNRQMSVDIDETNIEQKKISETFNNLQKSLIDIEKKYYNFCITNNIAKEQSRIILSEGLTITKCYMNGNLRSWIHYLQVRKNINTTQREHYDLANKIYEEIKKIFPLIKDL